MARQIILFNIKISEHTYKKLKNWISECDAKAVAKQRSEYKNPDAVVIACWNDGYPYFGAIGGGISYTVTPTSLGAAIKARYTYLDEELDLTEYENW